VTETPVILASGSESRRRLLRNAGVDAQCVKPNVDETTAKAAMRRERVSIRDQAMHLAELKAVKISRQFPGLVIGGDQMLALGNEALDKPRDLVEAKNHLKRLSGQIHRLETAIVVAENGESVWRHLARPALTVRDLNENFIDNYVETVGEPLLATVGAYQLEGLGAQLFSRIEGDYFTILGLPLLPLLDYLRVRGIMPS